MKLYSSLSPTLCFFPWLSYFHVSSLKAPPCKKYKLSGLSLLEPFKRWCSVSLLFSFWINNTLVLVVSRPANGSPSAMACAKSCASEDFILFSLPVIRPSDPLGKISCTFQSKPPEKSSDSLSSLAVLTLSNRLVIFFSFSI